MLIQREDIGGEPRAPAAGDRHRPGGGAQRGVETEL